jgi:thioredoxin reductase (NADPH)
MKKMRERPVLDYRARGDQAGTSARIENYLGFPTGISGAALMARAYNQAHKFGVEIAIPDEVAILTSFGKNAGRWIISSRRFNAAYVLLRRRSKRIDAHRRSSPVFLMPQQN